MPKYSHTPAAPLPLLPLGPLWTETNRQAPRKCQEPRVPLWPQPRQNSALAPAQPALRLTCACLLNRCFHSGRPEQPSPDEEGETRREARNWSGPSVLRTGGRPLRRKPRGREERTMPALFGPTHRRLTQNLYRKEGAVTPLGLP